MSGNGWGGWIAEPECDLIGFVPDVVDGEPDRTPDGLGAWSRIGAAATRSMGGSSSPAMTLRIRAMRWC
ncbi:hypothetical protein ACWDRR_36125 [Kitasatospora sp. NPDC003701]